MIFVYALRNPSLYNCVIDCEFAKHRIQSAQAAESCAAQHTLICVRDVRADVTDYPPALSQPPHQRQRFEINLVVRRSLAPARKRCREDQMDTIRADTDTHKRLDHARNSEINTHTRARIRPHSHDITSSQAHQHSLAGSRMQAGTRACEMILAQLARDHCMQSVSALCTYTHHPSASSRSAATSALASAQT